MARLAAVDPNGRVLEEERPPLIGVAFQAGLFISERLVGHTRPGAHPPSWGGCAVGIVAVSAGHETLVDAVL